MLKPKAYFSKVQDITIQFLIKNKIKALILDVDNTLIDYHKNLSEDVIKWALDLQGQGIKLYILSNSNHMEKIKTVKKIIYDFCKKFHYKNLCLLRE